MTALSSPPARARPSLVERAGAFLPVSDPGLALRLAFYLGGLILFGVERLLEYYGAHGGGGGRGANLTGAGAAVHALLPAVAVLLFALSGRSTVPRALRWLLPHWRPLLALALLATLPLTARSARQIEGIPATFARPHHYLNDSVAMVACGVDLLAHGRNPYRDFYLIDCLPRNGLGGAAATALQAGAFARNPGPSLGEQSRLFAAAARRHEHWPPEFESHFSYPAGSFVLPLPAMPLVRHDLGLFYLLCAVAAYLLLMAIASGRLRPWIVLFALANLTLWAYAAESASSDGLVVALLLAAWASWRRPLLSAALMGLAVATRQNAWFVLPFYAILVGGADGPRALLRRGAVIAAVFALFNAPFALAAPGDWLAGILGPVRDPMYAQAGLVSLAQAGLLPLFPRPVYTALELSALAACALYYARARRTQPDMGLALAFVPLLCAWRSPYGYVLPLAILALWPLCDAARRTTRPRGAAA